jgi:hypothetical protein
MMNRAVVSEDSAQAKKEVVAEFSPRKPVFLSACIGLHRRPMKREPA